MNFRNISSWCIRNPVPPIVLFVGLMLAGLIAFYEDVDEQHPGHRFPGRDGVDESSLARRRTRWRTRSPSGSNPPSAGSTASRKSTARSARATATTFVQFQIGTPTDRAVNDIRNAIAQIRGNLPEGILEPQITRVDVEDHPIMFVAAETTDMRLEQLSWYIDNTVAKRLLGVEGIAAVTRTAASTADPRDARSRRAAVAGHHRRAGQSQLRQSNMNAAGGRAEIAGSEQSVRVLGNARNAYELSQTNIACREAEWSGSPTWAKCGIRVRAALDGQDERPPGRQLDVQRAKGASEVTAYEAGWAELDKIEKDNPKVHFPRSSRRSNTPRRNIRPR